MPIRFFVILTLACCCAAQQTPVETNLALRKPAIGSTSCDADEGPEKAFNGSKMEYAQYLLANTGTAIKEIARSLGYSNEFAFSRAFRRAYGSSPSKWRLKYTR